MSRAFRNYNFETNTEAALDDMTDTVLDSVLLHEKGEVLAGKRLGAEWEQMLASLPRSKTEIMIRAVRDHLADSLTTLPGLISKGKDASLHFYFANLASMRKHIFPALTQAYETWVTRGERDAIKELVPVSETHWNTLANQMLDIYRNSPDDFANQIQTLVEDNKF
jgi:hypothetical protein